MSAYTSPDGKISADVEAGTGIVIKYKADGRYIRLLTLLADSVASADTSGPFTVDYTMVTGKRRHCDNRYNQADFRCAEGKVLSMRLYNDGVAWKYCGESTIRVHPEHWWLQKWVDCYEGYFEKMLLRQQVHVGAIRLCLNMSTAFSACLLNPESHRNRRLRACMPPTAEVNS